MDNLCETEALIPSHSKAIITQLVATQVAYTSNYLKGPISISNPLSQVNVCPNQLPVLILQQSTKHRHGFLPLNIKGDLLGTVAEVAFAPLKAPCSSKDRISYPG